MLMTENFGDLFSDCSDMELWDTKKPVIKPKPEIVKKSVPPP